MTSPDEPGRRSVDRERSVVGVSREVEPTEHGLPRESAESSDTLEKGSTQLRIEARVRQRLFVSQPPAPRIGRYLVLEAIGRGGMGVVYAAYDEQLDRKVAVKVLLDDELSGDAERLRLNREAQALARLSHPHVVTIHEVGESDGQLFLAMEYVHGQSLAQWLESRPDWTQVLEALVQAGRGLAAAHRADLIHRDLKPANIMRSEDGVVKVLDFGLARTTLDESDESDESDDPITSTGAQAVLSSSLTQPGAIVGTPAYMAPEQLRGDPVDARSDQYSFCVTLWEGLTGRRPFDALTLDELYAAERTGPSAWPSDAPPVPRTIVAALRRGLAFYPQQRWPTMDALLEALWWDPRRRRNRWLRGLTVVGILALGAVAVWAWSQDQPQPCTGAREQVAGIWDDTRRAEVEAAIVGVGPSYASDVWTRVDPKLSSYVDAWVEMHTEACEATSVRGEQSARALDQRMQCLHRARTELAAVVDTLSDADPSVVRKASRLVAGLRPLSRCADIGALDADVEPPLPADASAVQRGHQHLARAVSERRAGRYEVAREALEAASQVVDDVSYEPVRTELMLERGRLLDKLGDYEESEQALQEAIALASRWDQDELLAAAASTLMHVVGYRQQRAEAAMLLRPLALAMAHDDPLLEAESRNDVANVLKARGKYEEAEQEYRASLALRVEALGSDDLHVAISRNNLASVLRMQGKYEEAEAEYRAARAILEITVGPGHPDIAVVRNNLANVLNDQSRPEETESERREALAVLEGALGPEHPNVVDMRESLANFFSTQGEYEQAVAEYRAVLALKQERLGPNHLSMGSTRSNLASTLFDQGKHEEAEAELRAALGSMGSLDPDHPYLANARTLLASVLLAQDRADQAREFAEQAWARRQRDDVPVAHRADTAFVLARILSSVERAPSDHARALELADDALRSYRASGSTHPGTIAAVQQWLDAHPPLEHQHVRGGGERSP